MSVCLLITVPQEKNGPVTSLQQQPTTQQQSSTAQKTAVCNVLALRARPLKCAILQRQNAVIEKDKMVSFPNDLDF